VLSLSTTLETLTHLLTIFCLVLMLRAGTKTSSHCARSTTLLTNKDNTKTPHPLSVSCSFQPSQTLKISLSRTKPVNFLFLTALCHTKKECPLCNGLFQVMLGVYCALVAAAIELSVLSALSPHSPTIPTSIIHTSQQAGLVDTHPLTTYFIST